MLKLCISEWRVGNTFCGNFSTKIFLIFCVGVGICGGSTYKDYFLSEKHIYFSFVKLKEKSGVSFRKNWGSLES